MALDTGCSSSPALDAGTCAPSASSPAARPARPALKLPVSMVLNVKQFAWSVHRRVVQVSAHNIKRLLRSRSASTVSSLAHERCSHQGGDDLASSYAWKGVFPWPAIARSTEGGGGTLLRYHSFPPPTFSDDVRRPSWIDTVMANALRHVQGLWCAITLRNLLGAETRPSVAMAAEATDEEEQLISMPLTETCIAEMEDAGVGVEVEK